MMRVFNAVVMMRLMLPRWCCSADADALRFVLYTLVYALLAVRTVLCAVNNNDRSFSAMLILLARLTGWCALCAVRLDIRCSCRSVPMRWTVRFAVRLCYAVLQCCVNDAVQGAGRLA
jgi:hypothetical protein